MRGRYTKLNTNIKNNAFILKDKKDFKEIYKIYKYIQL